MEMANRHRIAPALPRGLLNELGIAADDSGSSRKTRGLGARKAHRKAARVSKKGQPPQSFRSHPNGRKVASTHFSDDEELDEIGSTSSQEDAKPPVSKSEGPKSILKSCKSSKDTGDDRDDRDDQEARTERSLSSGVRAKLAADDAEIEALERRLGLKGKAKLPKSFDDGFGELLEDLTGDQISGLDSSSKRKRSEEEEWLLQKRRKAQAKADHSSDMDSNSDTDANDLEAFESEFEGFESDSVPLTFKKSSSRENPYVAPGSISTATRKYIPPSQRTMHPSEAEAASRLGRQIQGLLNRLSESNLLALLSSFEEIYSTHPRQYVSSALGDLLMGLLCDPTTLQETFIILHAGFIAALFKVIGIDFAALMVQRIVEEYDRLRVEATKREAAPGKLINLVALLADLYTFQVIGDALIYDFVRLFLADLTELNTELLLKIIKNSGPQLRQNSPSSLKEIILSLQPAIERVGADNLSIRMKFMVEMIHDLKNNKLKTGMAASIITSEHVIRMKRLLGSLNTRNLKATEPLRVSLGDIRESDKRGKWWLVGASYRDEAPSELTTSQAMQDSTDDGTMDLLQLAMQHRMNTDIRRSIFITLLSATDYRDAHQRLLKLRLKRAQEVEIPKVLLHCTGAEQSYNPYYTLIAKLLCADRRQKITFQFSLWDILKRLEEPEDGEESEELPDGSEMRMLVNVSKLYGVLISQGALGLSMLKKVNFAYLQPRAQTFLELLLISIILQSPQAKAEKSEQRLMEVFLQLQHTPTVAIGLQRFLRKVVKKTDLVASTNDQATVRWGCAVADDALRSISALRVVAAE